MKIIIINPKKDFTRGQVASIESAGETTWIEDGKYKDNPIFFDQEDKIIAPGPEIIDWSFPNEFINSVVNLKAICISTTDFSWIDKDFLKKQGILLSNISKYSTEAVSEYMIFMMLGIARKIPLLIKNGWQLNPDEHQGSEIAGKIMGIIGLGSIGRRIAEIGEKLGMRVIYWSNKSRDTQFEYKTLNDVLQNSDFIFLSYSINEETKNLLNKERICFIKPTSSIINVNHDEGIDMEFALSRINQGLLSGMAFESEKKSITDFEGNVLVTPPVAWMTKEASAQNIKVWVQNILSVVKNNPENLVN